MMTLTKSLLIIGLMPLSLSAGIIYSSDASALVNTILGSGINVVGTPTLNGTAVQFGIFSDMASEVGFANGIVLSSGDVGQIQGSNGAQADLSTDVGGGSDPSLFMTAGYPLADAAVLEFNFRFGDGSTGGDLFFNFVFGSDEYLEFVGTQFIDIFGFYVDGENLALIGGSSITVNAINTTMNSSLYRNNPPGSGNINVLADGMTTVLLAQRISLGAGDHSMKIGIADTSDGIYDSIVFIQAGSFSDTAPIPEPASAVLSALGLLGLAGVRYGRARRARA